MVHIKVPVHVWEVDIMDNSCHMYVIALDNWGGGGVSRLFFLASTYTTIFRMIDLHRNLYPTYIMVRQTYLDILFVVSTY